MVVSGAWTPDLRCACPGRVFFCLARLLSVTIYDPMPQNIPIVRTDPMTDKPDTRATDEFLAGAYGLKTLQDAMAFYDKWAQDYDDRMEETLGYVAPRLMAERLAAFVADPAAEILDVGCGTGLTSHYLKQLGFMTFDGIDLNPHMLDRARERGIYRSLIQADITRPIDLPDGGYDAVISSGTFTLGHVGSQPIPELVRVLRPGGVLGCSVHRDIWGPQGFEASFAQLEAAGTLHPVERAPGEFFTGFGKTALYCVYRKV